MKKLTILVILLLSVISVQSQSNYIPPTSYKNPKLSVDTVIPLKKRPWMAAGVVVGSNIGVWAFDRYVLHGDWAYIDIHTMKRNLDMGFYWDNDNFQTNMFNHPYNGALYFGAARGSGLNYWQSGLYSLGGSTMWELFMECELPSKNDLVATSIGGMALGETFFRLSDAILDDRSAGWERVGREALGIALSPGRGITRILTGQAWKKSTRTGRQYPNPNLYFYTALGLKVMELKDNVFDEGMGACLDLGMIYGDLYQKDGSKPYDYFSLRGSINMQKNQPIIGQINLTGRLYGSELYSNKNIDLFWGVYQHYDYYDSDTISDISNKRPYELGTPACFGVGLALRSKKPADQFNYWGYLHTNGIILGSSISDYYFEDERGYNWGSGYSIKTGGGFSVKEKFALNANFENYRIFTWKGYPAGSSPTDPDYNFRTSDAQGDKSNVSFNVLNAAIGYNFNKRWGILLNQYLFVRRTRYAYKENVSSTTSENRLMVTYKF